MGYTIRAQGGWICDIPPDRGHFPLKAEANARLIAAAPELNEWSRDAIHILKYFLAYAEEMRKIGRGTSTTGLRGHSTETVIRALENLHTRIDGGTHA